MGGRVGCLRVGGGVPQGGVNAERRRAGGADPDIRDIRECRRECRRTVKWVWVVQFGESAIWNTDGWAFSWTDIEILGRWMGCGGVEGRLRLCPGGPGSVCVKSCVELEGRVGGGRIRIA